LFGATSVIGSTLARLFPQNITPIANPHNRAVADSWRRARLEDPDDWRSLLVDGWPATVIYAHAVCDVAKCQADPGWARRINVEAVERLLDQLPSAARLVYLSSDHVFGGDGCYRESSAPSPISVYGQTRVEAERLVLSRPGSLVLRFGLPIGPSLNGRNGFLDWLRYRQRRGLPITVIGDECRSAVWADDLARRIMAIAESNLTGLRHLAATRCVARPQLARHLMALQGIEARFAIESRAQQPHPHLGRVEIVSDDAGELSLPLTSVMDVDFTHPSRPPFFQGGGRE
jgi:dTDP-4-dehydrorhamnose reductase